MGDPKIMNRSHHRTLAVVALLACLLAPASAPALSLLDLDAGASFTSGDGDLMFSFEAGSITLAGALSSDLSLYTVNVLGHGFRVTGPMAVADGGIGVLTLAYDVGTIAGTLGTSTLASLPSASGLGALAFLGQSASGLGDLVNAATGGGLSIPNATLTAQGDATSQVLTSLQLMALQPAQFAAVAFFEQTFGVAVPEPSTGVLLLAGLLGLALIGNRVPLDPQ